jgi:hypothetical protein
MIVDQCGPFSKGGRNLIVFTQTKGHFANLFDNYAGISAGVSAASRPCSYYQNKT